MTTASSGLDLFGCSKMCDPLLSSNGGQMSGFDFSMMASRGLGIGGGPPSPPWDDDDEDVLMDFNIEIDR